MSASYRATFALPRPARGANAAWITGARSTRVDFFNTGSASRWLDAAGRGVYARQVRLWSAGEWRVYAAIPCQNGVFDALLVGSVTVQP